LMYLVIITILTKILNVIERRFAHGTEG